MLRRRNPGLCHPIIKKPAALSQSDGTIVSNGRRLAKQEVVGPLRREADGRGHSSGIDRVVIECRVALVVLEKQRLQVRNR